MRIDCNLCVAHFNEKPNFIKHLKKSHGLKEGIDNFKCPNKKCGREYIAVRSFNRHIDSCFVNNIDGREFSSRLCEQINQHLNLDAIPNSNAEIINTDEKTTDKIFNQIRVNDETSDFQFSFNAPIAMQYEDVNEIEYIADRSTKVINTQLEAFTSNLIQLKLTNAATNTIFKATEELISNIKDFILESIKQKSETPVEELLHVTTAFVLNGLKEKRTTYRRNKFIESQSNYVKPSEICLGTKWKKSKDGKAVVLEQERTSYQSVSLLEKLKSLFSQEYIKQIYFDYQESRKQKHTDGIFNDFYCGSNLKKNPLFSSFPDSLQIQIFIDGFEVCNPLKTKVNKHSQIAIYFSICNMPPELAYNLDNIHLLALCNTSYLKTSDVNYNDLWECIIREVSVLENEGIILNDGRVLKGTYNFTYIIYTDKPFEKINVFIHKITRNYREYYL